MDIPTSIDSKFRFILIAAKRTRQLQSGARPQVQSQAKKPMKIAQQEVISGLVPFELVEAKTEGGNHSE